jgi:hypothetical protein
MRYRVEFDEAHNGQIFTMICSNEDIDPAQEVDRWPPSLGYSSGQIVSVTPINTDEEFNAVRAEIEAWTLAQES